MKALEFLKNLASYRTVISISVSMVLKVFVAHRVIGASSLDQVDDITNFILAFASIIADGFGIFFRMKASKPGQLTPQYAGYQAWVKGGKDRRNVSVEETAPVKTPPDNLGLT
jgi:hypothetical protein